MRSTGIQDVAQGQEAGQKHRPTAETEPQKRQGAQETKADHDGEGSTGKIHKANKETIPGRAPQEGKHGRQSIQEKRET